VIIRAEELLSTGIFHSQLTVRYLRVLISLLFFMFAMSLLYTFFMFINCGENVFSEKKPLHSEKEGKKQY